MISTCGLHPESSLGQNDLMNILSGWREQYDRMLRSHDLLREVATGTRYEVVGADHARDALIHFYMDAYQLKDWIKNDPAVGVAPTVVEGFVNSAPALCLCADLANGTKHLRLTSARTNDLQTRISSQSVIVRPGTARARATVGDDGRVTAIENLPSDESLPAIYSWAATSNGQTIDLLLLADGGHRPVALMQVSASMTAGGEVSTDICATAPVSMRWRRIRI